MVLTLSQSIHPKPPVEAKTKVTKPEELDEGSTEDLEETEK